MEDSPEPDWRASVEIPEAGKRFGFSSLEQLFAFLIDYTDANCDVHALVEKERAAQENINNGNERISTN